MNKVFFFLFFSTFLVAQELTFKIEKSELFTDEYKDSKIILVEKANGNDILILRSFKSGVSTTRGFYIEKYDKSLKKIKEFDFEISHPVSEKYSLVIGAFFKDSKFYIIEMFYDLKSKNYVCQANIIDENYKISKQELFKLSKEELKGFGLQTHYYNEDILDNNICNLGLFELEEKSSYNILLGNISSKTSNNNSGTDIVFKVNNKKTLFSIALSFKHENEDFTRLFLFDSNLNVKIKKELVSDRNEVINKNIELHDSQEVIYLTQKVYLEELKKKETGGKYIYEIKQVTSSDVITKKIDIENHYIPNLNVFNIKNKLYCLGFYSDNSDFKYKGISFFELDSQSLEIVNSKFNSFSDQFLLDKYGEIRSQELRKIIIKNVYLVEDELIVNAEEQYSIRNPSSNRDSYNYDDIISIRLNSKGDLFSARNINKRQSVGNLEDSPFVSYKSCLLNKQNYFFINAKDKTKELSKQRVEFKGTNFLSNSNLFLIKVNENGDFSFNEILSDEENEVPFMVSKGVVIDNSIVFLGRKGKKKQLLKVTI
ncbi:hypothetical protein [Flavobacterium sp.]|uniref:hypothetical protein n=1 Tax=Flavobacterium sp. TaxID=239 RepID=UPI0008B441F8|nr:hypothetical protein [Flavobacterium sp.]OGS60805.1 MAG: hypothetical protein A2X07_01720 [Flavobacteria bacterium GWF1_32_7]HBD26335.1 hypothetical protein [Flavobacterium sp.]